MKDKASAKSPTNRTKKSVVTGGLLAQLITITDLTIRNSNNTQEQKEALELKELLESHRAA